MAKLTKPENFHVWFPNIFQFKGGIQVYSAFLLEALQNLRPNCHREVFLKHDTCASPEFPVSEKTTFHFSGRWPEKLRTSAFAAQILSHGFWKRPDLVLMTHLNFTLASNLLKRGTGTPYWTIIHGIEAWDIQDARLQQGLHHADLILAVSNYTRERFLQRQNIDPDKVQLLPNTFDAERFTIAPKPQELLDLYQLHPEQPVILTVARLDSEERYKGYDQIIRALPYIRRHLPNIRYILVGKGQDRPRVERLIAQCQVEDCVTLAGFIPDEDLCNYYNLCDIFAMPSKGEGFGIVYLEALACGKPVLGGNQDGAIDALCEGKLGILIDPDDLDAIAETIVQTLQGNYPNPILYQPEILRQKVIETYGFAKFQQTFGQLLDTFAPGVV